MDGQREHLVNQLDAERLDRGIKWTAVAGELNISPQHLLRIRKGAAPVSADVAAAMDKFLRRDRGVTWKLMAEPAHEQSPSHRDLAEHNVLVHLFNDLAPPYRVIDRDFVTVAEGEPTDEQLAEMTNRQIAELAIRVQNERGPDARRELLQRAKAARDRALDDLLAESSPNMNDLTHPNG